MLSVAKFKLLGYHYADFDIKMQKAFFGVLVKEKTCNDLEMSAGGPSCLNKLGGVLLPKKS